MAEPKRTDLALRAEKAVLVQVVCGLDRFEADQTLRELESLTRTAGAIVAARMRQQRNHPDPAHYVGKGKLVELAELCRAEDADVVICDDELTPAQVKRLEESLQTKVVDRTEVILDIFAAHARSKQARLQVELAQLEYEFPRLTRMWTHLDRTAGGTLGGPAGGGIGVRGPGEKQLEVDRRLVQRRIHDLKKSLEKIEQRRSTAAENRGQRFPTVALVGYTNAGKSSLMNALTDAAVSVRDRLFETLDTRTRRWSLPDGRQVLLSDTVGFVRKFPHHLTASFHATLAEAREADMLLHVVDAAKQESEQEIGAVNSVLKEIDCADKPTLYLLNKVDMVDEASELPLLQKLVGDVICTSAVTGRGLDDVQGRVARYLDAQQSRLRVRAGLGNGKLFAFLHRNGHVLDQSAGDGGVEVTLRIDPQYVGRIESMGGTVERLSAEPGA